MSSNTNTLSSQRDRERDAMHMYTICNLASAFACKCARLTRDFHCVYIHVETSFVNISFTCVFVLNTYYMHTKTDWLSSTRVCSVWALQLAACLYCTLLAIFNAFFFFSLHLVHLWLYGIFMHSIQVYLLQYFTSGHHSLDVFIA